ncbi:MAG: pentapeptide repeat-containing protein [Deltaproteobacteria bacterium]|nr:pentapeptide repeat-containing protein [Deltaproteobacteria bacterium]
MTTPVIQDHSGLLELLVWLALGAVFNGLAFGTVVWGLSKMRVRERLANRLERELGYFRAWGGEEGILRKTGLIRDLNRLGLVPQDLEQVRLEGARLAGARLGKANLREAVLVGAVLQGADLEGADLWGADLSGANLNMAGLAGANLRGADLRGAVLIRADFRGANLHRADLTGANVEGAMFDMANLERARFAGENDRQLPQTPHPSVEDWIRGRLDGEGRYQERLAEGRPQPKERKGANGKKNPRGKPSGRKQETA